MFARSLIFTILSIWPKLTAASTVQFTVVILLEKCRFHAIKVYFCLKNAKKKETGATGVNVGKHWITIDSFCSPCPRKPLNRFKKLSPSPKNHWSVRKTSPSPLLLLRGTGTIREPLHSMSPSVLSNTNHTLGNNFLKKPPWNKEMNGLHKWDKTKFKIVILKSGNNLPSKFFWQSQFDKILNLQVQGPFQKKSYFAVVYHSTLPTDSTLKIKKSVWIYLHLIKFKLPLLPTWEPFLNQPYDHEPFNTPPVLQSFLEKEEHIAVNHIISLWDLDKLTLARQTASNDVKLTLNCEHKRNEEERTNKKASKNKSFTTLKEVKQKKLWC